MLEVIGATVAVDKYRRACRASVRRQAWLCPEPQNGKPNIAPGYSSGQVASASQPVKSPESPGLASYPLRSRSSHSRIARFFRWARSASRMSAERFIFVRRAAASAARKSLESRTTWIVSIVDPTTQSTPQSGHGSSFSDRDSPRTATSLFLLPQIRPLQKP